VPAFAKAYEASRPRRDLYEVRESILKALGDKGDKLDQAGRDTLTRGLTDPAPSVRLAAANALEKLTGKRPAVEAKLTRAACPISPWTRGVVGLRFETSRGAFDVDLFPREAPLHVANVVHLARGGFYDGLTWHRVVTGFVVQGGDPRGDGWGDPGWTLPDEVSAIPYTRGTLGMPKAGKDTGGCQLFFTHGRAPHLDGRYTVFGRIVRGVEVLDLLEEGDAIIKVTVRYSRSNPAPSTTR
jgi:cyclophilin family peptidyl-prolyl cis-trans isomerase